MASRVKAWAVSRVWHEAAGVLSISGGESGLWEAGVPTGGKFVAARRGGGGAGPVWRNRVEHGMWAKEGPLAL